MKKVLIAALTVIALTACSEGSKPEVKDAPATQAQTQAVEKQEEAKTETQTETTQAKTEEPATQEETKAAEETPKSEAGLGKVLSFDEFDIVIHEVKKVKDYEGKEAVQITYDYTNKKDEGTSAFAEVMITVFQEGVQVDTTVAEDSTDNEMKQVKKGATVKKVQAAYLTQESAGNLTIQVEPSFSLEEGNSLEFEVPYPSK